jgi:spectinomycin phosphotransferase
VQREDPNIDKLELAGLVERSYSIEVRTIEHVPLGECSHGYRAQTETGDDLFVKIHTHTPAERDRWDRDLLEKRLATLVALRDEGGIEAVVAPLATVGGMVTVEHTAGPLAVFPWIDGGWVSERGRTDADTGAEGRLLGTVHASPPTTVFRHTPDLVETFEIPYAATLRELLTKGVESGKDDPAFPIRALLRQHQDEILTALRRLETLGQEASGNRDGWVPTHGDPSPGNVLKTPAGCLYLVDWDGIALGPPERDFAFFSGRSFSVFLDGYQESRPAPEIKAGLIAFYLYHWDLQEIADWGCRLVHLDSSQEDNVDAWQELAQYLPVRNQWVAQSAEEMERAT